MTDQFEQQALIRMAGHNDRSGVSSAGDLILQIQPPFLRFTVMALEAVTLKQRRDFLLEVAAFICSSGHGGRGQAQQSEQVHERLRGRRFGRENPPRYKFGSHDRISFTTFPCTSVSRISRPPNRHVSCSW